MFGAELQNRMTNQRRKRTETSSLEKEAFIEELRSEKRQADKQFVKNKLLDMEVWSCIGEELKSKLLDLQNKEKLEGKNVTDSSIEQDETRTECTEESNKRKVDSDSVGKKLRKTDHEDESVPSTSKDTEESTSNTVEESESRAGVK